MIKISRPLFLFLNTFLIFLLSCSSNGDKKIEDKDKTKKDVTYSIPPNKDLDQKSKKQFTDRCALFFDSVLAPSGFNGGIIVAKGGNIVFEKYKTSLTGNASDSITSTTPLHIASVSKTFTAMAILKLQEQGKLNIDDDLTKFFPNFNYPGVTIKTLLNHRSGLPNYIYFMEDAGWNKDSTIQNTDVLNWLVNKKGLIKDIGSPDKRFNYCNTNYALLALVIEKVSGVSYPAFMKANIFDAIGLKNTFVQNKTKTDTKTKSYDWKGREIPLNFLDEVYGDKNIYSTVQDLLKWDRILSDTNFLSQASHQLAYTPYSNERPGIKNYGLGWRMNVYDDGKKMIFHNGWWHGSSAAFIRLLKEDATIICISNRFARSVYKTKYLVNLFDHYLNIEEEETDAGVVDTVVTPKPKAKLSKAEKK